MINNISYFYIKDIYIFFIKKRNIFRKIIILITNVDYIIF